VIARGVEKLTPGSQDGRWGRGGGHRHAITYTYAVGGVEYTSDKTSFAHRGVQRHIAEEMAAAIPDEVDVHYDPERPAEAYLEKHTPRLGYWLIAGGALGSLLALVLILG
jgi:hypothetical protein